ncbi:MAG: Bug family tripartite tricarboxylate transporter substrate binding protein [Aquabacterium sp.]|nr:Bug family tripartite tricarboxylate transporter substrate binding protein [Aquabacterium sp.]
MTLPLRRLLIGAVAAACLATTGGVAFAQSRTVKILVGFPAGGGTDAIARTLAEKLKDELGATVIVENKPGAGGQLAAQALKAAPADGNTVFISHDHTISVLPLVSKNPGFDPVRDFTPVAGFASFVNALAVSPGTPARNLPDYVAWIRNQGQGKGVVGIPAPASTPEFLVKLLGEKFRLDLVSAPYRGSAPMMGDMLGNQIAAGVGSIPDFIENHRSGRLRVVAVGGTQRQAVMPEVQTLAELGVPGFEEPPYYGFFAPAGTPRAALDAFAQALAKVLAQQEVKERLTAMGLAVEFMTADQLGQRERAYTRAWTDIIRKSGFQPL